MSTGQQRSGTPCVRDNAWPAWAGLTLLVLSLVTLLFIARGQPSAGPVAKSPNETLSVGVLRDAPPKYQLGEDGKPGGFAIDTLEHVAAAAGFDLRYKVFSTWTDALAELDRGTVDLLPNVGISPERQLKFDFSAPVETAAIRIFVRASGNEIHRLTDLIGGRIATVKGELANTLLEQRPEISVVSYDKPEQALVALLASRVDALAYAESVIRQLARDTRLEDRIVAVKEPLAEVQRAIAVRKGNTALLARLTPALEQFVQSPAYQRLYSKWHGAPRPFWTSDRVLTTVFALIGTGLFVGVSWLVRWRFRAISALNRRLQTAIRDKDSAVAALVEREADFRLLAQSARDGILVEQTGRLVFTNHTLIDMLHYQADDLAKMALQDILRASDYGQIASRLPPAREDGNAREAVLIPRWGVPLSVEITAATTHWQSSPALLLVVRDITERKKTEMEIQWHRQSLESQVAERTALLEERNSELRVEIAERLRVEDALKRSEALVAAAQQLSDLGAWEWTTGTEHVSLTEEARRILGLASCTASVAYEAFLEHIHPDHRAQFIGALYRALGERATFDIEYRIVRPDGSVRPVRGFGCAFHERETGTDRVVGAIHDLTEAREMQQIKREFVSVVSHELRTPLTSIRGALGLLEAFLGSHISGETRKLLDIALRNTHRLVHLVNDILDVEKLESGRMQFALEPVDLVRLVEDAVEANSTYAREFSVVYTRQAETAQAWVLADAKRLTQVLTNLMANAAKFARSGTDVRINVTRYNGRVRVAVTDSGCGISETFRTKIFDKFTQQDVSDARAQGGSGLGLAISKAIIEQLGGTIDFVSEIGVGTTFFFEFPEYLVETSRAS